MHIKKISYLGTLVALALTFSYFERLIPSFIPVPGIKLGLSNIVVLITMYLTSNKDAFFLSFLRILLVAILFGGVSSFIYGLSGGMLSFFFMSLFKRLKIFSIVGVSVIGGISHNLGQIVIAIYVVDNLKLIYYMPILIISGTITGILIGFISYHVLKSIQPIC